MKNMLYLLYMIKSNGQGADQQCMKNREPDIQQNTTRTAQLKEEKEVVGN